MTGRHAFFERPLLQGGLLFCRVAGVSRRDGQA
ncbi:hypothetical protein L901_17185 [Agrobacterium sp. D14]|nr:hypothetical protein L901_17185 [Agrobacterium sp. D14]